MKAWTIVALASFALIGCQQSSDSGTTTDTASNAGMTTGSGDYAKVQEIFNQSCVGCHGETNPKEGVRLTSYETVMKGSEEEGPLVEPGNAKDSLLVKALRGDGVDRMPYKKPPLPEEQIQLVEKWINDGAKG